MICLTHGVNNNGRGNECALSETVAANTAPPPLNTVRNEFVARKAARASPLLPRFNSLESVCLACHL